MAKNDNAKASRQREFYHNQRIAAEETGDQSTVNKIYGKLGKKAPQVGGTDRVDNAALGLTTLAAGGLGDAGNLLTHIGGAVLSRIFPEAAEQIGTHLAAASGREIGGAAEGLGTKALGRGRGAASASRADIPVAQPRALPRGSAASRTRPLVKAKTVSRVAREKNVTPRGPLGKGAVKAAPPKALPRGKATGPDFKQPAKVKAGTPRAKQTSARAKGSNPRQLGKNPRARKKAAT